MWQMLSDTSFRAGCTEQAVWLGPALDEIDYGIVLWSHQGLVHCNRAAVTQLGRPDCPLKVTRDEMHAGDAAQTFELREALTAALGCGLRRLVRLSGKGDTLALAVVPLVIDARDEAAEPPRPGAMVVMGKRDICPRLTTDWFCMSHRLTPAESSVLDGLLAGHGPRVIAERNGVKLSTVRTQIASIKGKTATRGIRELLMAAAALPPIVPMALNRAR